MEIKMNNIDTIIESFNLPDAPWGVDYKDLQLLEQEHYNCLSERNNLFEKESILVVIVNPENIPEYKDYKYIIKIFSDKLNLNENFIAIEKEENVTDVLEVKIQELLDKDGEEVQSNIYTNNYKNSNTNIYNHLELINHEQLLSIISRVDNEEVQNHLNNILSEFKSHLLNLYMEIKKSWH